MGKRIGLIDVDGYNGKYVISRTGEIFSTYKNFYSHGVLRRTYKLSQIKPSIDNYGYYVVNLYDDNGCYKTHKLHRLVALTFLSNPDNKRCVCHKDNNKLNCCADNLYWGTDMENIHQARRDGLFNNEQRVAKCNLDGSIIKIYVSQSEASRENNIPQANIWKCLTGKRKTAGGYIWQKLA